MLKPFLSLVLFAILVLVYYSMYPINQKHDIDINIALENNHHSIRDIHEQFKQRYDFGYLLNSNSCLVEHKILLMVTSYVGHAELRNAHRRAFPNKMLEYEGIKRIFLLSKIPQKEKHITQTALNNENDRFDDIVQGNFTDSYRNLTLKHIMGLRWAYNHCPLTEFVIKLDDDIVINLLNIMKYLQKYKNDDKRKFLLGYVFARMTPYRFKSNKWYVLPSEYNETHYPPFLSGWMYITTPHTAALLVSKAFETRFFWIDDVFVSGILADKLKIKLKDLDRDKVFLVHPGLVDCCINDMNNKNISCEYSVGPNGGNSNKIFLFQKASESCFKKHCHARPHNKPLDSTCILSKKHKPLHKGKPLVRKIKL